jgi:nicotinamide-nucleotide amidase
MLGVDEQTLKRHGAVSEEVAIEMAVGALARSHADVSVAVTGIAGPTGAVPGKPVGTVHFAWGVRNGPIQARRFRFEGDRTQVRIQSVYVAIQGLIDLLR